MSEVPLYTGTSLIWFRVLRLEVGRYRYLKSLSSLRYLQLTRAIWHQQDTQVQVLDLKKKVPVWLPVYVGTSLRWFRVPG